MSAFKRFIKCMLGDCPDISSKRVVGFTAFIVMILMALFNVLKLITPAEFMFNASLSLVLGCFGFNAVVDAVKASRVDKLSNNIKDNGGE